MKRDKMPIRHPIPLPAAARMLTLGSTTRRAFLCVIAAIPILFCLASLSSQAAFITRNHWRRAGSTPAPRHVRLAARQPAQPENPFAPMQQRGEYLRSLKLCEQKLAEAKTADDRSLQEQTVATLQSFVGEVGPALAAMDRSDHDFQASVISADVLPRAKALPAIDEIVKASKGRQIVMLNEAHISPRCRVFALQLARALRKEGFAYFAAETFSPNLQQTVSNGYPNRQTGFYSLEPCFGDLIRNVMKLGYKLVPYETETHQIKGDSTDQINAREIAQSHNLEERILKQDPKARIFVYAGYSHITENWRRAKDGREFAWMAARLKRDTGIDPLTIDQTIAAEHSDPKFENVDYTRMLDRFHISRPTVFREENGNWRVVGSYRNQVDMQVFYPRTRLDHGRPSWLRDVGRRPYPIPAGWVPKTGRALIQAFVQTEKDDAIPIDQVIVTADSPPAALMLPKGEYRIQSQTEDGTVMVLDKIST